MQGGRYYYLIQNHVDEHYKCYDPECPTCLARNSGCLCSPVIRLQAHRAQDSWIS